MMTNLSGFRRVVRKVFRNLGFQRRIAPHFVDVPVRLRRALFKKSVNYFLPIRSF
ncbi:hypothetical protein KKHLCK_03250 [Candidatus Electrothrix laxa]